MTLSEKILSLRAERGMTQDGLAEKMEVSRQSVSKWETGQSVPDLDKIVRMADLFGITMDELVREGELPPAPEPAQPQVVYVERKRKGLTRTQVAGVVFAAMGLVLALIGFWGAEWGAVLIAAALIVLSLPLLLAKRNPWLPAGWLLLAMSFLVLNPLISGGPWGLAGGLRILYILIIHPEMRKFPYYASVAVGIARGLMILILLYFTWRTWKKRKPSKENVILESIKKL